MSQDTKTPALPPADYNYQHNYDPSYAQSQAAAYPYYNQPSAVKSWFDFSNANYAKGFVIGAGVALVLANPAVQKAIVSGAVKLWSGVQGGVEEVKERIHDIKAEMSSKE